MPMAVEHAHAPAVMSTTRPGRGSGAPLCRTVTAAPLQKAFRRPPGLAYSPRMLWKRGESRPRRSRRVLLLSLLALFAAAPPPARAAVQVQAGIGFVALTGAEPGVTVVLADRRQREVARGTTDRFGSLLFRDLERGRDYLVRQDGGADPGTRVGVLDLDDRPDPGFYQRQRL